jgi:nucleoside 2-deoxyribosyltransferase
MTYRGEENRAEIETLCGLVRAAGFVDFCFVRDVEHYEAIFDDPRELMARSRDEILASDALLIDMTAKPTGRAIEAGIAYAAGRRVVILMRRGTAIKATARGIADAVIEYNSLDEIMEPLRALRAQWAAAGHGRGQDQVDW